MKQWQVVLEEFATAKDPMTWEMPCVRIEPNEKYEAVLYLVEKGLLKIAGRVRDEHCDNLYQITPEGRFCWEVGFTELRRRKRPTGKKVMTKDPTLAERTVKIAHRDVFDLTRLPWTFDLRAEERRNFPEAYVTQ